MPENDAPSFLHSLFKRLPVIPPVLLFDKELNLVDDYSQAAFKLTLTDTDLFARKNAEWRALERPEPYNKGNFSIDFSGLSRYKIIGFSLRDIDAHIKHLVQQPTHPCAFALKWAGLSSDERKKLVVHPLHGSHEELEHLLRCLAYEWAPQNLSWKTATWQIEVDYVYDETITEEYLDTLECNWELEIDDVCVTYNVSQMQLIQVVHRYFLLLFDQKSWRHYWNVQWWLRAGGISWTIDVDPPSHHERLQAHLFLRDWLRDKVAPEEIPFLLGETDVA